MSKVNISPRPTGYALTGDSDAVAIQSLSRLDTTEAPIRKYLSIEYKNTRPRLLDYILANSPGDKLDVAPTLPRAVVGVHTEDVSTVISACYKFAEGNSVRSKLERQSVRNEALQTADYLGERVSLDFGHELRS